MTEGIKRSTDDIIDEIINIFNNNINNRYFLRLKDNFIKQYEIYLKIKDEKHVLERIRQHKNKVNKIIKEQEERKNFYKQVSKQIQSKNQLKRKELKKFIEKYEEFDENGEGILKQFIDLKREQSTSVNMQKQVLQPYENAFHAAEKIQSWITKKLYGGKGIRVIFTGADFQDGQLPQFYFWEKDFFNQRLFTQFSQDRAKIRYRATQTMINQIKQHKKELKSLKVQNNISEDIEKTLKDIHKAITNRAKVAKGGRISLETQSYSYSILNKGDYWEGFAYWFFEASEEEYNELLKEMDSMDKKIDLFIQKGALLIDKQHGFFSADIKGIYAVKSNSASAMQLYNLYLLFKNLKGLLKDNKTIKKELNRKFFDTTMRNKMEKKILQKANKIVEKENNKII